MIGWIVGASLRFRTLVLGLAAVLLVIGSSRLATMPRDILPEFVPPYVEVQTEALGLSAEEVEQLITVPLEADLLHGVAWLHEIQSRSVPGLSSIVLVFDPGTDVIRARQMVAERLTQAHALPNVSRPPVMLQPLSSTSRVMMVGLASRDVSLIDMSVLAWWTIKPRLMGVPGVANVAIWGQRERQLQVLVDPGRMRQADVSLRQVIETTGNSLWVSPLTFLDASTPGTGGFIDTPNQRLGIQHILPITTPADLARVPIEGGNGARLGDVAQVVEDHQPLIGDAIVGDAPGLLLVVEKFPDANAVEVTRGLDAALTALKPGLTGVTVDSSIFRPAGFIESSLANLALASGVGVLLVTLLLLLLLGWRAALVALVAIPVSLAAAISVLHALGATANAMIVAGLILAMGIVIDDVVVGTERVIRRVREHRASGGDRSTASLVLEATVARREPIVYATVIAALSLAPVAVAGGVVGAFLPPLAAAYLLAVLASLLVALTVTPVLTSFLFRSHPGPAPVARLAGRLEHGYAAALAGVLRRARATLAVVATLTLVAALLFVVSAGPQLARSLVPEFRERDLLVRLDGAAGTSRTEMDRIVGRLGAELRELPGIRNLGAHVGRAITSDTVSNTNAAEVWITLDPAADYDRTIASIDETVAGYPGLDASRTTYSAERIGQVLGDPDQDFVVRVYGQEQEVIRAKAEEIREALVGIEGVVDPTVGSGSVQPTLQIQVDLAAAERSGIKAGDVRRETAALLSGIQVGSLFEDQKVFEVVVWGRPELRNSITSIGDLLIDAPGGATVRLADIARVRIAPTPTIIEREGVFRIVDVGARVSGRDIGAVLRDVHARLADVAFPLEYRAEVRSAAAERQAGLLRLLAISVAAAIAILILLQTAFASWRLAALTFLSLPAAVVGGVLAGLAVDGGTLSFGALAGLFAVLTLAVRSAALTVRDSQELVRSAGEQARVEAVIRGARQRLLPVMTTALAIGAAVAPFFLVGDGAGLEIVRPMAAVILGGLVSSSLLSLFVLPTFFSRATPSPAAASVRQPADQVEQPAAEPA